MDLKAIRKWALSLAEVTEAPHHDFGSFRVRGKIFVTVPPGEEIIHVFLPEAIREMTLAIYPDCAEKLFWGEKALGLRVWLERAPASLVKELIQHAWEYKAPKSLVAAARAKGGDSGAGGRPPTPRARSAQSTRPVKPGRASRGNP